jgi:hypothetical protein
MPERKAHTDTLHAGMPFAIGGVALLPIVRVVMETDAGAAHAWISAAKEPYALVVLDAGGTHAVSPDAKTVSLDALRGRIPGLDAILASMQVFSAGA